MKNPMWKRVEYGKVLLGSWMGLWASQKNSCQEKRAMFKRGYRNPDIGKCEGQG